MLNIYICDYLFKHGLHASAKALLKEGELGEHVKAPIDAPRGFLEEWWSVHWDIYMAKTKESGSDDAIVYTNNQARNGEEPESERQQMLQPVHAMRMAGQNQSGNAAKPVPHPVPARDKRPKYARTSLISQDAPEVTGAILTWAPGPWDGSSGGRVQYAHSGYRQGIQAEATHPSLLPANVPMTLSARRMPLTVDTRLATYDPNIVGSPEELTAIGLGTAGSLEASVMGSAALFGE